MDADIRLDDLATIFEGALACLPEARTAYLDEACLHNADLRAELDSLLVEYCWAGILPSEKRQRPRWRSGRWHQQSPSRCLLFLLAQVSQYSIYHGLVLNAGDDPDRTTAATADFDLYIEYSLQSLSPGHTRKRGAGSGGMALGGCADFCVGGVGHQQGVKVIAASDYKTLHRGDDSGVCAVTVKADATIHHEPAAIVSVKAHVHAYFAATTQRHKPEVTGRWCHRSSIQRSPAITSDSARAETRRHPGARPGSRGCVERREEKWGHHRKRRPDNLDVRNHRR